MRSFLLSLMLIFVTYDLSALPPSEVSKIQAVSDEWRNTYKFDKETFETLQASISGVIDTHALLERENLDPILKEKLEDLQRKSLQGIVNQGSKFLPYVLREYSLTLAARAKDKDWNGISDEVRKTVSKNLRLKEQALEAAIVSMGLAAIPNLSDLQARAMRKNADLLSKKMKSLLESIVQREELQKESAKLVGEGPQETSRPAREVDASADLPKRPVLDTTKSNSNVNSSSSAPSINPAN